MENVKIVKAGGRVRRELANYILLAPYKDLAYILCELETYGSIPSLFNCDICKKIFGDCGEIDDTGLCANRLEQYDNMSYIQNKEV